jgi:outer membrane lipoprotein SlyB
MTPHPEPVPLARRMAGACLLSASLLLAACDPQTTIPIGPASAAPDEPAPASTARQSPVRDAASSRTAAPAVARADTGEVIAIEPIVSRDAPTGVGAAVGGVAGGLLGNQIGSGGGRKTATVLGAVGGALAGNEIEKHRAQKVTGYRISVRLDNGEQRTFSESSDAGLRPGDRVRLVDGSLQRV